MRRRVAWWVVAAVAAGATVTWGLPLVLRQLDFFRVRQVEIAGARYLTPEAVLEALQLGRDHNVFDDHDQVERRAASIPGVVAVRVTRRLPGTLRVELRERVPVAFVPSEAGLVALDGDAQPLPYDPTVGRLDLPIVARVDTMLVRTLALVRAVDSTLYSAVDGARRGRGQTVILEIGQRDVLFTTSPTTSEIRAVEAVRRHLTATGRSFAALDARFAGWIVVRRSPV